MEYPKILVADGSEDCVNVVFEGFEEEEVKELLHILGWTTNVRASHDAMLAGEKPLLEAEYLVVLELLRYHIRLFRYGGKIVGNIHFNNVDLRKLKKLGLHVSDHEKGMAFLKSQLEGLVCTEIVKGECSVLVVKKCL